MTRTVRVTRALHAMSALALASALAAWLWQPALPAEHGASFSPPVLQGTRPAHTTDPALARAIVDGNIFSAARTPPATRYRPFESLAQNAPAPVPASQPRATGDAGTEGVPRLFGTLLGPQGASALLRLDPGLPEAQLYREGDRAGAYRVEEIHEQSVVLSGPRGRITLRLSRSAGPSL